MTMKKTYGGTLCEQYYDCPYCGKFNNDVDNDSLVGEFKVKCERCGKTAVVTFDGP